MHDRHVAGSKTGAVQRDHNGDETEKVIAEATRQRMKNDLGEACSLSAVSRQE